MALPPETIVPNRNVRIWDNESWFQEWKVSRNENKYVVSTCIVTTFR